MLSAERLWAWGFSCCVAVRNGYILLHRQGLTEDEWKHPLRTLAWIDFLTMAAWEDFTADDGVRVSRGEVIASYGFLAKRWRVSKDTAHTWLKHWIAERQVERRAERCTERSAERFFLLNYAKYQETAERVAERTAERSAEQMKGKQVKTNSQKENRESPARAKKPDVPLAELERPFKATLVEQGWCEEDYAGKTWDQGLALRGEHRVEFERKLRFVLTAARHPATVRLAKKVFHEIAGYVNDFGAMQSRLSPQELEARRAFREETGLELDAV
jgi:hypothetical protein